MYTSPDRRSPYYDDDVADADGNYKAAVVPRDAPAVGEMTPEQLLDKAGQLQHLLGRFIACRPVGAAKSNRVVAVSLYPVVKESVQLYCDLTEVMAALIDQFPEMETADCERVHDLFVGLANDMDELQAFYAWCKDACVCRQSDVPDVEVVTHKKLQLMDEFIRDRRAAESQQPHHRLPPPSPEPAASPEPPPPIVEENVTKALPAPEEPASAVMQEPAASPEPEPLLLIAAEPADEEADFLNLKADAMSSEAHGHQMALALFNGNPAGTTTTAGDAFDPSSADWETALVQSASALATQRAELGGGFNTMVLDGMYGHATANATVASAQAFSGSASSVAMRPPGAPMLALPGASGVAIGADPFAASAVVPPPMYVQMSDLQTKQQLLREEQMVWQRYGKNGMQGPGALAMLQQRPHHHQQMPHGGHNYYAV
ncbi:hypothetical protein PR202_gb01294 [Eleusine coracana subsp. coracana]|uniref:AP180 N-terminal homology (ANTH) domain-containing protein n=1 Tax=Eleusine coracana subsp. coracana TaxID=191504 RepID=A0AAV5DVK0_ELECO|nr:hypothetical protein PR202_gb01294 [Eleusine coracana subsp. coracana]